MIDPALCTELLAYERNDASLTHQHKIGVMLASGPTEEEVSSRACVWMSMSTHSLIATDAERSGKYEQGLQ